MIPRTITAMITYNGVDATIDLGQAMSDFSYTDSTEASDTISITVNDPDKKWSGAWMPINGDRIRADILKKYWSPENQAERVCCGDFIVDSFKLSAPPQKLVIEGVSSPVDLDFKETKHTQTWEKVTIREIASEIAGRYGLTLVYDTSEDITLDREEQNEDTDSAYLSSLCKKYGLGLKVYSSQIVIWSYKEYEAKPPIMVIAQEQVTNWSYKGSLQGTYTGAKVTYSDAKKDKTIEAFVGKEGRILTVNEKAESIADAERIGKNALQEANRKEITMDITLPPDKLVTATSTVQVVGFGKVDGKYFITKVSHKLSSKSYTLKLDLYHINSEASERPAEGSRLGGNYVIKSGDSLWDIAKAHYQDGTRCTDIYEANRDTIESAAKKHGKKNSSNGYWVYSGTELIIP